MGVLSAERTGSTEKSEKVNMITTKNYVYRCMFYNSRDGSSVTEIFHPANCKSDCPAYWLMY